MKANRVLLGERVNGTVYRYGEGLVLVRTVEVGGTVVPAFGWFRERVTRPEAHRYPPLPRTLRRFYREVGTSDWWRNDRALEAWRRSVRVDEPELAAAA